MSGGGNVGGWEMSAGELSGGDVRDISREGKCQGRGKYRGWGKCPWGEGECLDTVESTSSAVVAHLVQTSICKQKETTLISDQEKILITYFIYISGHFTHNYIDYTNKMCWVSNTYYVSFNQRNLPGGKSTSTH